jgi:dTMP kinase
MPIRGKFIVLEGIDGSGKRTQMEMLARAFASRRINFTQISFPRYEGFFGKMVAQFLNGDFGPLESVDPHFSALLYAGDRFESKPQIEAALAAGKTVLADRYVASNLAHQGARMPLKERAAFLNWLREVEYGIYGLPVEDLVIYLRVPPAEAQRLVAKKGKRQYTRRRRDLQEANLAHLKSASSVYDELSRQPNWVRIDCTEISTEPNGKSAASRLKRKRPADARRGRASSALLRSPEAIHTELLGAIDARLSLLPPRKG